jgi:glutathione S-transferase
VHVFVWHSAFSLDTSQSMPAKMKLYQTPTSPFVRKVLLVAHETGLISQLEPELLRPSPLHVDATLSKGNPLSKIPALLREGEPALYDSRVICEYLDSLHDGRKVIPASGGARFEVLRQQALADGILDAAILVFYELRERPSALHWPDWIEGQKAKAQQGLSALEQEAPFGDPRAPTLGHLAVASALGWLEFRSVLSPLWDGRPRLRAFFDAFRARPSMVATEPHA